MRVEAFSLEATDLAAHSWPWVTNAKKKFMKIFDF
jgi:hypothetical protein